MLGRGMHVKIVRVGEGSRNFNRKPGDALDAGLNDLLLPVFKDGVAYRWIGSTNVVAKLIQDSAGDVRRKKTRIHSSLSTIKSNPEESWTSGYVYPAEQGIWRLPCGPSEGVNKAVFFLELPELFEGLLLLQNSLLEQLLAESVSILSANTEVATHLVRRKVTRTNSLHKRGAGNTDTLSRNGRRQIMGNNLNVNTLPLR